MHSTFAQTQLPISHQPKKNQAVRGTTKLQVNPTQPSNQVAHPVSVSYSMSLPSFEPQRVVVQEVEVDQEVEPGLRGERVVEEGGDGAPQVELVEEVLPREDQPLRAEQAEAAEQREQDGEAEPVPGEDRQGLEPVLKFKAV